MHRRIIILAFGPGVSCDSCALAVLAELIWILKWTSSRRENLKKMRAPVGVVAFFTFVFDGTRFLRNSDFCMYNRSERVCMVPDIGACQRCPEHVQSFFSRLPVLCLWKPLVRRVKNWAELLYLLGVLAFWSYKGLWHFLNGFRSKKSMLLHIWVPKMLIWGKNAGRREKGVPKSTQWLTIGTEGSPRSEKDQITHSFWRPFWSTFAIFRWLFEV